MWYRCFYYIDINVFVWMLCFRFLLIFEADFGAQNGSEIDDFSCQNLYRFLSDIRIKKWPKIDRFLAPIAVTFRVTNFYDTCSNWNRAQNWYPRFWWSDMGPILDHFWTIFGPFLDHFWDHFWYIFLMNDDDDDD